MDALEPKKLALLRILQILQRYSDIDHPLLQEDIATHLEIDFGIILERKAISRNIALLKDAGYDIVSDRHGSYLSSRIFENSELRMLIDGVLSSRYITANHSKELIEKLCGLTNKYFKSHVNNIHSVNSWNKTDNQALFLNIEIIDNAIENDKQIIFDYNKYGIDKKLHKTAYHAVSPYQLIVHNQRYYLMAFEERWKHICFYRISQITDMKITDEKRTPLNTVSGYENGVDYGELASSLPYMYPAKPENIVFYAEEWMTDAIIDWFGKSVRFEKEDDRIKVTLKASPDAMQYWAMQYLNCVEIIKPIELREKIKENINKAQEKYI